MKRLLPIIIIILILFSLGCENNTSNNKHIIKYTVETSISTVSVTLNGKIGNNEVYSGVIPPWEYSFESENGDYLYISAVSAVGMALNYTITVNIYKDGVLFKTNTASGVNAKAIAYGTL
jgi:hypothetical protein